MRRVLISLILLPLSACASEKAGSEPVQWKAEYTEAECKALMSENAITERCGGGDIELAKEALRNDPASCVPYSPAKLLSGVWVRGFEHSEFFEGARTYQEVAQRAHGQDDRVTWLSTSGRAEAAVGELPRPEQSEAFHVDVIGRRSLCEYGYGHEGLGSHEVIAEELIGATALQMSE
jgi:hypothetical protein